MGQVQTPAQTQTRIQTQTRKANPVTIVNRDLSLLHPIMRLAAEEVVRQLNQEDIPFAVFEAFRSPSRQAYLFAQGRSRPGSIITKAQPWESYHQYGLSADFVLTIDGQWSWEGEGGWWERLVDVGKEYGLEPLSFEKPHLQIAGLNIHELIRGQLPGGGDESWSKNFAGNANSWKGFPSAPRL